MSELKVTVLGRHFSFSMYSKKLIAVRHWPTFSQALIRLEYVITERSQPAFIIWLNMWIACAVDKRSLVWNRAYEQHGLPPGQPPPSSGLLAGADEMEYKNAERSQPPLTICLSVQMTCAGGSRSQIVNQAQRRNRLQ